MTENRVEPIGNSAQIEIGAARDDRAPLILLSAQTTARLGRSVKMGYPSAGVTAGLLPIEIGART